MKDALGSVQSVLVLGGGSDIARETVRALSARRVRKVVLALRDPGPAEPLADELRGRGVDVEAVRFDALDFASHPAFVEDVWTRNGDIDLVLLAFGVLGDQETAEKDVSAAVEILETNFVGAASVALLVATRLRAQGHGTLVVLSSVAGDRARRANFVYGSSKAGLDAFAQGLGDALVGTGASVLIVRPGFVTTKMTAGMPQPPLSTTPDVVATAIVRALERGEELVYVPPVLRAVMSAVRHLPRPLFRRLKV